MRSRLAWPLLLPLCGVMLLPLSEAAADARGDALLKKVRAAMTALKSLRADLEYSAGGTTMKGSVEALKPGYGRLTIITPDGGRQMILSDGKDAYMVQPERKEYQKVEGAGAAAQILGGPPDSPLEAFFSPSKVGQGATARVLPPRKAAGQTYQVLELTRKTGFPPKTRLLVNAAFRVVGMETELPGQGKLAMWLRKPVFNPPLPPTHFAYVPPADFTMPKGPEDSLLAVGAAAPDFLLDQPGNQGLYGLEQARKDKKAVLINFWFYS
jgi:outer membrane lipoprotein-sorting protein